MSKPTIYSHFGTKEQLFRASIADSAHSSTPSPRWARSSPSTSAPRTGARRCTASPPPSSSASVSRARSPTAPDPRRDHPRPRGLRVRAAAGRRTRPRGPRRAPGDARQRRLLRRPRSPLAAQQFLALIAAEIPTSPRTARRTCPTGSSAARSTPASTPSCAPTPPRAEYPRSDSNRHWNPFKGSASAIGLRGRAVPIVPGAAPSRRGAGDVGQFALAGRLLELGARPLQLPERDDLAAEEQRGGPVGDARAPCG